MQLERETKIKCMIIVDVIYMDGSGPLLYVVIRICGFCDVLRRLRLLPAAASAGTWNVWNPFGLLRSMIQKAAAAAGWRERGKREGRCLDRTTAVFRNTTASPFRERVVTGAFLHHGDGRARRRLGWR